MSEDTPTQTGELGEMPEPTIEPGEVNPGGVDAMPDEDTGIPADLDPEDDPATEDAPEELKEGEDTDTEATRGDADEAAEVSSEDESPA